MPDIQHEPHDRCFATCVDGHRAELVYVLHPGLLAIVHTRVPSAVGGRGIAASLVATTVAFARKSGFKVAPECSYAAEWMRRHPEQQDLLA